jgi:hypothetical protein
MSSMWYAHQSACYDMECIELDELNKRIYNIENHLGICGGNSEYDNNLGSHNSRYFMAYSNNICEYQELSDRLTVIENKLSIVIATPDIYVRISNIESRI